jgi:hypothetical protein
LDRCLANNEAFYLVGLKKLRSPGIMEN